MARKSHFLIISSIIINFIISKGIMQIYKVLLWRNPFIRDFYHLSTDLHLILVDFDKYLNNLLIEHLSFKIGEEVVYLILNNSNKKKQVKIYNIKGFLEIIHSKVPNRLHLFESDKYHKYRLNKKFTNVECAEFSDSTYWCFRNWNSKIKFLGF